MFLPVHIYPEWFLHIYSLYANAGRPKCPLVTSQCVWPGVPTCLSSSISSIKQPWALASINSLYDWNKLWWDTECYGSHISTDQYHIKNGMDKFKLIWVFWFTLLYFDQYKLYIYHWSIYIYICLCVYISMCVFVFVFLYMCVCMDQYYVPLSFIWIFLVPALLWKYHHTPVTHLAVLYYVSLFIILVYYYVFI